MSAPHKSENRPMRIGLIGAGWVTQHHLAGWSKHANRARVVSIADPNQEQAQSRASAFGIDQLFESAEKMLAHGGLDAVDIASPRETHADLVRMVARHGLPVLCQKPLAPTYQEACALVAQTKGMTRLMVHENWRFRPYYRQISKWLNEHRIGPVVQAQMTLLTSGLIENQQGRYPTIDRQPFMASLNRALVMEILIHHIDTLRFLLGDMHLVHARLGHSCKAMTGEDRASLIFEASSGATVSLLSNLRVWGEPEAKPDELLLIGETGTIRLSGDTLSSHGNAAEQLKYDMPACYSESYAATIGHFLDALEADSAFETNPEDNLQTLRLVEEIYAFGSNV